MEGAKVAGGINERAMAALEAGCDMVLVCNDPKAACELLDGLKWEMPALSMSRLARCMASRIPDHGRNSGKMRIISRR
jgi:beta-N-acetylhexosaminidase